MKSKDILVKVLKDGDFVTCEKCNKKSKIPPYVITQVNIFHYQVTYNCDCGHHQKMLRDINNRPILDELNMNKVNDFFYET